MWQSFTLYAADKLQLVANFVAHTGHAPPPTPPPPLGSLFHCRPWEGRGVCACPRGMFCAIATVAACIKSGPTNWTRACSCKQIQIRHRYSHRCRYVCRHRYRYGYGYKCEYKCGEDKSKAGKKAAS